MFRPLIVVMFAPALLGQFHNLATTDDGSSVVFSSSLRMRGTNQPDWEKLFRIDSSGLALYAERDRTTSSDFVYPPLTNAYRLTGADFSGDGSVTVLIGRADCTQGGSSCFLGQPKYQSEITGPFSGAPLDVTGQVRLSRNGRYAVACCGDALAFPTTLHDLQTGATREAQWSLYARPAISSTGIVVGPYGQSLRVFGFDDLHEIPTAASPAEIAVDDVGTTAFYSGTLPDGRERLARVDLATGIETAILEASDLRLVGVSNGGNLIAFLSSDGFAGSVAGSVQLYRISPNGAGLRRATAALDGISEAVLAGGGGVAYAVTFGGRLIVIKFDLAGDAITELVGRTVTLDLSTATMTPTPSAGSAFCVRGTGFTASPLAATPPLPDELGGLRLLLDGHAVPIESAAPAEACFQVPWETAPGTHSLSAVADSDPRFEGGNSGAFSVVPGYVPSFVRLGPQYPPAVDLEPYPVAAHQDFSGLVTRANPARPGEIVHFYVLGLGPVSPAVRDGEAAPADPPAVVVMPTVCGLSMFTPADALPVEVLFAGLAPGLVGYYQLSVRLPAQVPAMNGDAFLSCRVGSSLAGGGAPFPVETH